MVAYVQQLAILLGAMVLFNIAVFPSRFALFVLRRCHNGRDHTTSGRTKRVLELLAFPKLTASLLTALMGFQKTQIMLALVTQITTIIALRDPSLLAAATPLQMNFVRHYLYLINTSIILAVSFGILLLRKGTKRVRPQIQLASACSIFMGMATALILWFMNVNFYQHRQDPPETHRTLQCGGVNPMQHCEVPQEVFGDCSSPHITDLRDDKYTTGLNLTLSRAGFFIRFGAIIWTVFLLAGVALAGGAHPKKSYRRLEDGYYFICEVLFSWIMYSTISTLLSINRDDAFAAGRSWSIGQILAVMVWTPALIEWLYLIWGQSQKLLSCDIQGFILKILQWASREARTAEYLLAIMWFRTTRMARAPLQKINPPKLLPSISFSILRLWLMLQFDSIYRIIKFSVLSSHIRYVFQVKGLQKASITRVHTLGLFNIASSDAVTIY